MASPSARTHIEKNESSNVISGYVFTHNNRITVAMQPSPTLVHRKSNPTTSKQDWHKNIHWSNGVPPAWQWISLSSFPPQGYLDDINQQLQRASGQWSALFTHHTHAAHTHKHTRTHTHTHTQTQTQNLGCWQTQFSQKISLCLPSVILPQTQTLQLWKARWSSLWISLLATELVIVKPMKSQLVNQP